jgi:hypothetical protein
MPLAPPDSVKNLLHCAEERDGMSIGKGVIAVAVDHRSARFRLMNEECWKHDHVTDYLFPAHARAR